MNRGKLPPGLAALLLGNPELSEQLMRALEIKGDLPQRLEDRYQPVLVSEDFTADEFRWLRRSTRWSVGVNIGGVAGQFAFSALGAVATTSRTMAVVERVVISNQNAAAATVQYGLSLLGSGLAMTSIGNFVDDRQFGTPRAAYAAGGNTQAAPAIPAASALVTIPAGGNYTLYRPGFVLTGRDNGVFTSILFVTNTVVAQGLQVTYHWRERNLATSEL